ncbi:MAG: hypothetical protein M1837_005787, partial [Sclerophora amabilis]
IVSSPFREDRDGGPGTSEDYEDRGSLGEEDFWVWRRASEDYVECGRLWDEDFLDLAEDKSGFFPEIGGLGIWGALPSLAED